MRHELPATPETVQWGYFDNSTGPVLTVDSGDTVMMECLTHHAGDAPDLLFDDAVQKIFDTITPDQRGPGVHLVTGPVAVRGAEPGDTLEVRVLSAQPRMPHGVNFEANWGLLYGPFRAPMPHPVEDLETHEHVVVYESDWDAGVARGVFQHPYPHPEPMSTPGVIVDPSIVDRQPALQDVTIPLRPHLGTAAVASHDPGRIDTVPPGRFGGNVDNREFVAGTSMFYPVQVSGGLFWGGDPHHAEGDGEISGTAIEGHLNVELQFVVHKGLELHTPVLETETAIHVHGFDENLDEAVRLAAADTIHEMTRRWGLTQREAYSILSVAGDLRVTQVVNGVKGAHFVVSKSILGDRAQSAGPQSGGDA